MIGSFIASDTCTFWIKFSFDPRDHLRGGAIGGDRSRRTNLTTKFTKSAKFMKCRGGFETRPYLTPFVLFVLQCLRIFAACANLFATVTVGYIRFSRAKHVLSNVEGHAKCAKATPPKPEINLIF